MTKIRLAKPTVPLITKLINPYSEVLKSGMLTNAKYVSLFENKFGAFLKNPNAAAVSSGTSALMLAVISLGLKGEVILPSFTYSSTGHVLLWNNLKPVFADINPETFNLDPTDIARKINKNTSAIMAVHCFGNPADISAIQTIARRHRLKVIYDAAHAFGSRYHGRSVATYGDASIFSFTPTKVITTAEGGIITVKDKNLIPKIKLGRYNGDSFNRQEEFLGITARLSEFNAILGLENLKTFSKNLKRRLKLINYYKQKLSPLPGLSFQKIDPQDFSVYKDMVVIINAGRKTRDIVLTCLHQNNIEAKTYFYPPLHHKKVYRQYRSPLPQTDWVANRIISLPLYSSMPLKEIDKVCRVIKEGILS